MGDVQRRATLRRRVLRHLEFMEHDDWDTTTVPGLRARLVVIQEAFEAFETEHAAIMDGTIGEADRLEQEGVYDEVDELVLGARIRFEERIAELTAPRVEIVPDEQVPQGSLGAIPRNVNVPLERIRIPTFDGNFAKWRAFRDLFQSLVCDNQDLSDVQKMHHLKSSLQGEAAGVIESWAVTQANFDVAWERLQEVYDDEYQIVNAHLRNLFDMPYLRTANYAEMRRLIDRSSMEIRSMRALGIMIEYWDPVLMYLIVDRLDVETAREWEMTRDVRALPLIADLYAFLERRVRGLTQCKAGRGQVGQPHEEPGASRSNDVQRRVPARDTSKSAPKESSGLKCFLCKSPHPLYVCPEFLALSVQGRINRAKAWELCLNCFSKQHATNSCPRGVCHRCQKKHNSVLCIAGAEAIVAKVAAEANEEEELN